MNDVNWIKQDDRIKEISNLLISSDRVLETNWKNDSYVINIEEEGTVIDFDLSELLSPILGNFWKVLYNEGDFSNIKSALINYWKYKKPPMIQTALISFENSINEEIIQTKLVNEYKLHENVNFNQIVQQINESFEYDKVVIGSNSDHLELQFLDSSRRCEVRDKDYVDPGIFLFLNGKIQIAAGINRLVCTNGLTERIWAFKSERINDEILQRAIALASWLRDRNTDKICSIRELAVILNGYPEPMKRKFWKNWSQRIELNELTWFDVIDDITNYAKSYMDKTRQNLLQFPETLKSYRNQSICPTCSAKVK